jgi:hypothetical protein
MKQASLYSSTDHGGGKRRVGGMDAMIARLFYAISSASDSLGFSKRILVFTTPQSAHSNL